MFQTADAAGVCACDHCAGRVLLEPQAIGRETAAFRGSRTWRTDAESAEILQLRRAVP